MFHFIYQATQHPTNLLATFYNCVTERRAQITKIVRYFYLGFQFIERSSCNTEESGIIAAGITGISFSNVTWDRDSTAAQLRRQCIDFLLRECFGISIHFRNQLHRLLPYDQITKARHSITSLRYQFENDLISLLADLPPGELSFLLPRCLANWLACCPTSFCGGKKGMRDE